IEELEQRLVPVVERYFPAPFPAVDLLFKSAEVHFTGTNMTSPYDQFRNTQTTRNADKNDAVKSAIGDIHWWTINTTNGQIIQLQNTYSVANGSTVTFSYNQAQTLQPAANEL